MSTFASARPRLELLMRRTTVGTKTQIRFLQRRRIRGGVHTPLPEISEGESGDGPSKSRKAPPSPFYFDTGYGLYAKRASRPFPPPFTSPPSGSFSDPLSTHDRSRDRRPQVNGEVIRGLTNGDDAVVSHPNFIGANDGVGQWAQRDHGHAALWSRLILHFWALEVDKQVRGEDGTPPPDPIAALQTAYEQTTKATSEPNQWFGTTTVCGAVLHHATAGGEGENSSGGVAGPLLYATNLGDSQIMVVRPSASVEQLVIYKSEGQWHWFDCPFQLGTNSKDTPSGDARLDRIPLEEGDVVIAMSDGVPDNLWEHEIADKIVTGLRDFETKRADVAQAKDLPASGVQYLAQELVEAASIIAEDPYAESPYMERAIEEGLPAEGGKLDDISVVIGICKRREE